MAITGSGTEADPYIVHNYTELAQAVNDGEFIELANDIDCNTYGEDFIWHTVRSSGSYNRYTLDLKGHTIKNFKVAENECAFILTGTDAEIKNGKILNCYLGRSEGFCKRTANYGYLRNLSISINSGVGIYGSIMFEMTGIEACAIYIEGKLSFAESGDFSIFRPIANGVILNSDILLDCSNNVSGSIVKAFSSGLEAVKYSRIRGIWNSTSNAALIENGNIKDSVVDLTTNATRLCGYNTNNNGIINTDKTPSNFGAHGMTAVTSQEIINGDSLRAKGFDVINVVGE